MKQYRWHIFPAAMVIALLSALTLFLSRALKLRNIAVSELYLARKNFEIKVAERTSALVTTNSELKQALDEIKTLKGILPLCSFCKKIKNEQNEWEPVDTYIDKYSEADVSHGICPDFLKDHYPEIHNKLSQEK